jgi:hypothetical protein
MAEGCAFSITFWATKVCCRNPAGRSVYGEKRANHHCLPEKIRGVEAKNQGFPDCGMM